MSSAAATSSSKTSSLLVPMSAEWRDILQQPLYNDSNKAVPQHVNEITKEFVQDALRRLYGNSMPSIKTLTPKIHNEQGLMSEVQFLFIEYDDDDENDEQTQQESKKHFPTKLVAKGCIPDQEHLLAMGFSNEIIFYTQVPQETWSARPTCYFCEGTMMLLEVVSGTHLNVFDEFQASAVGSGDISVVHQLMEMLARLHKNTWRHAPVGSGKETETKIGKDLMPRRSLLPMLPLFVNGTIGDLSLVFKVFQPSSSSSPKMKEAFEACEKVNYSKHLEAMFHQLWYPEDCPDCLVLGDIKRDNMFVSSSSASESSSESAASSESQNKQIVTLIDFQGCGWGPATADVFFLLCLGTSPEYFAANWETHLKQWYDALTSSETTTSSNFIKKEEYSFQEQAVRHFRGSVTSLLISCAILAKRVKDNAEKLEKHQKEEEEKDTKTTATTEEKEGKKKKEQELKLQHDHEFRLSEMLMLKWCHAMHALGLCDEIEKLAVDPEPEAVAAVIARE